MEDKKGITNEENRKNPQEKNANMAPIKDYTEPQKNKKILNVLISVIVILLVVLIFSTIFALTNINNTKIISGIKINNIAISKLSEEEAKQKIDKIMQEKVDRDIKIVSQDFEYQIKLAQIELKYDIDTAIKKAYAEGRRGNIFIDNYTIGKAMLAGKNIELDYAYNEEALNKLIIDIASNVPNAIIEPTYYIENKKLFITKGIKGNSIDETQLKSEILNQIKGGDKNIINVGLLEKEPNPIDIDKIHQEVYKEPKDAYYTKNPFRVYTHVDGIDFDVEKARELLKEDKEEYEIDLKITAPKVTINQIGTEAFPNLLSSFSTRYNEGNHSRANNLKIAMGKLNGAIVLPGEVFSYNQRIGKRTAQGGYRNAPGFAGGRVVPTIAGGICQICSTLYDAVVYANLEVIERYNHMFLAGYVGAGKDATTVYGRLDFKFRNTRKYPILIKGTTKNGIAKVDIYGIKEPVEYEVDIVTNVLSYKPFRVIYEADNRLAPGTEKVAQDGMNGCKSITYKILKLNGVEVSREILSSDVYDPLNKIIKIGPSETVETISNNPEPTQSPTPPTPPTEPPAPPTPPPESPTLEPPESGNEVNTEDNTEVVNTENNTEMP